MPNTADMPETSGSLKHRNIVAEHSQDTGRSREHKPNVAAEHGSPPKTHPAKVSALAEDRHPRSATRESVEAERVKGRHRRCRTRGVSWPLLKQVRNGVEI